MLPTIYKNTNWKLLSKQKLTLVDAQGKEIEQEFYNALQGIINFLDTFQDSAVNEYSIPEKTVFPKLEEI